MIGQKADVIHAHATGRNHLCFMPPHSRYVNEHLLLSHLLRMFSHVISVNLRITELEGKICFGYNQAEFWGICFIMLISDVLALLNELTSLPIELALR